MAWNSTWDSNRQEGPTEHMHVVSKRENMYFVRRLLGSLYKKGQALEVAITAD